MQNVPSGYDPVTLNHWLWYKFQCHECSPSDFQRLFEDIMKRAHPEFMSIRPYGNIGDRKCDGLFFVDTASTVFQVYSPDEITQKELIDKIDEDLEGAYVHWNNTLKRWVFVYNARRGLPPDVPKALGDKKQQYPTVELDHLSSDGLWEKARALSIQQRAEILGAPSGYEHLFFSSVTTNDEINDYLEFGSFVLVQDLLSPISLRAVSEALAPAQPFGAPFFIRPSWQGELPWTEAALQQRQMIREIVDKGRELIPHFSVFSLAPIPLVVHLGFVLSDRVEVRCYQFDRQKSSWKWPQVKEELDINFKISGLPTEEHSEPVEVAISIALSAPISKKDVYEAAPHSGMLIEIAVDEPDIMWLRSEEQLVRLADTVRRVIGAVRAKAPNCSRIHLFYAGPTGGAVVIGQQLNPRMNPPIELYQFSMQTKPRYRHALTLTEELS